LLDHFLVAGSPAHTPLKFRVLNDIPPGISRDIHDEAVAATGNALTAQELLG